jgi:hypothetical protein
MDNKFLRSFIYYVLAIAFLAFTLVAKSQSPVALQFSNPQLVSGTDGQVGATYKFPDVTTGTDAYITIEYIAGGAVLKDIDNTSTGYYSAWQPTVGGPCTYGSSYIKWDIKFKDKSGNPKQLPEVDATGIDIDGDAVRVREFTMVNGQSSYNVPTQIPTALTITTEADTDNVKGTDASTTNLKALGPVTNRVGIDTLSQDVRIDYVFQNTTGFKFYTGSEVDNNGNTGPIATDRYHSIYFQKITGNFNVLPIVYQNFNAIINNNAINLAWQSDADSKNGHFEIQKGFSSNSFNTIAVMMGALTQSGNMSEYNYADNSSDNASHNIIYYRLKIVEANGNYSYSPVLAVKLHNDAVVSNTVVKIFPNPYMEKLNISFNSKENGTALITLCNASGSVVKELHQQIATGNNNFAINNLLQQSAGIYFLNVSINGRMMESHKLMKM